MAMSFSPQMQNFFGKGTDFTKLSSAYGDSSALGVQADIQGNLIREQAKNRAERYKKAGENALSLGQTAGSAATTSGIINGVGSAVGGFMSSDMFANMFSSRPSMDTPITGVDDNPFNLSGGINGVRGGSPVDSTFGIPKTIPSYGGSSLFT